MDTSFAVEEIMSLSGKSHIVRSTSIYCPKIKKDIEVGVGAAKEICPGCGQGLMSDIHNGLPEQESIDAKSVRDVAGHCHAG